MEHVVNLGGPSSTILRSFSTARNLIPTLIANDKISSLFFDKCQQFQCTHKRQWLQTSRTTSIFVCQTPALERHYSKKRLTHPQNTDLPPILPKSKKKPYPMPLKKILEASRADKKLVEMGIEKLPEPPKNGLLVSDLVPVAYEVVDAWKILIKGISQLLHVIPVHACSECSEVHVGQTGYDIQS